MKIVVSDTVLQQVKSFKYLGSIITADGKCETEIKTRIAMAKVAFTKRKELLCKPLKTSLKKIS